MADLEAYIQWFYHNASVGIVDDGNLENGTGIQVPNAKRFGNRWHARVVTGVRMVLELNF